MLGGVIGPQVGLACNGVHGVLYMPTLERQGPVDVYVFVARQTINA